MHAVSSASGWEPLPMLSRGYISLQQPTSAVTAGLQQSLPNKMDMAVSRLPTLHGVYRRMCMYNELLRT